MTLDKLVQEKKQLLRLLFSDRNWRSVYFLAIGMAMREWLLEHSQKASFDIIETVDFAGYGGFFLDRALPPVVVTCHGSLGQLAHYNQVALTDDELVLTSLEISLLAQADEVVAHSPSNAQDWSKFLGRDIKFILAPWIFEAIGSTSFEVDSPDGLVVGRLEKLKGAIDVAKAVQICIDQGLAVQIRWVGRNTHSAPGGQSMAEYLHNHFPELWGSNLTWLNHLERPEVRRAQASASFVLVPSIWDAFNYVVVEAMSTGTPIIVSSGAGASFLCHDGENSLVVPPGEPELLAIAIKRLSTDPGLRRDLGEAGRKQIKQTFTPERIVGEREQVYQSAIARRHHRLEKPYAALGLAPMIEQLLDSVDQADTTRLARLGVRRMGKLAMKRFVDRIPGIGSPP